jgi:serine protease Do
VLVTSVVSASPAAQAGIQVGDAVTAIDGTTVRTVPEMLRILASHRPGDSITLTVWRGENRIALPVTLDQQSQ